MQVIKKRLRPGLREQSENLTRTYNKYEINNTNVDNKEKNENNDYLKFVKDWYKNWILIKIETMIKLTTKTILNIYIHKE